MKKIVLLICIIYGAISNYIASLFYIEPMAHIYPSAKRIDINYLTEKGIDEYTNDDYDIIFQQTGLGRLAVENLFSADLLIDYQESYFA